MQPYADDFNNTFFYEFFLERVISNVSNKRQVIMIRNFLKVIGCIVLVAVLRDQI
jgi:hypothetical protein